MHQKDQPQTLEFGKDAHAFAARLENARRRLQAQLAGAMKYEIVFPCPYGHTIRLTSNNQCVICSNDARAERKRRLRNVQGN
jgi:hypothetical protein